MRQFLLCINIYFLKFQYKFLLKAIILHLFFFIDASPYSDKYFLSLLFCVEKISSLLISFTKRYGDAKKYLQLQTSQFVI